ncbi:MAG: hypothetical protein KatS3mg102_0241 [Planctomycetota bacterium]|nr:MAG: hypothetical protein KatS3mg102_0241 [Planctomycetota bacterium]
MTGQRPSHVLALVFGGLALVLLFLIAGLFTLRRAGEERLEAAGDSTA